MEIFLVDKRVFEADGPNWNAHLGNTDSMEVHTPPVFRDDRSSYQLSFMTDLAYELNIKLTKVEMEQLKSQLIEATEKRATKKSK